MTCSGIHWHQGRPYDNAHNPITRDDQIAELTTTDYIEAAPITSAAPVPREVRPSYDGPDPDDVLAGYERLVAGKRAAGRWAS